MGQLNPLVVNERQNAILEALSASDWNRIRVRLQPVKLPRDHVIHEPGASLDYVYFPTTAMVSLLYELADGRSVGTAVVGRDGVVGIALFMGGDTTPSRAVVQSEGMAYRIRAQLLKDEFARGGELQHLLLRYAQALITQMSQTAVCNRHHSIDQQLCRLLLVTLDRLASVSIALTQELIANMLGVRRESITAAAGNLQNAGLIWYTRGRIIVLDRPGIEARCCECYAVVKRETDRLFPLLAAGASNPIRLKTVSLTSDVRGAGPARAGC